MSRINSSSFTLKTRHFARSLLTFQPFAKIYFKKIPQHKQQIIDFPAPLCYRLPRVYSIYIFNDFQGFLASFRWCKKTTFLDVLSPFVPRRKSIFSHFRTFFFRLPRNQILSVKKFIHYHFSNERLCFN